MGTLSYGGTLKAEFDDRLLAHLQMTISAKLRRGESFIFTWKDAVSIDDGPTTVWVHPAVALVYKYSDANAPALNRHWLEALTLTANSVSGLQIVPEPDPVERQAE